MFLHLRPPYEAILFGHIHPCSLALPKYWQAKTASRAREQRAGRRASQLLGKVKTRERHSKETNHINKPHDGTGVIKYF